MGLKRYLVLVGMFLVGVTWGMAFGRSPSYDVAAIIGRVVLLGCIFGVAGELIDWQLPPWPRHWPRPWWL